MQLDLWPEEVRRIPWLGLGSLRDLTKIAQLLSLRQEPEGHEVDPEQYEMFSGLTVRQLSTRKRGRRNPPPAPSLLPLGWEGIEIC